MKSGQDLTDVTNRILTGLKEVFFQCKPVLVMRETTERPEAVDAGTVKLVGTDKEQIIKETKLLLIDKKAYNDMSFAHNPYGDDKASEEIINTLKQYQKR